MKFEENNVYHGFKLLEEKEIKEINSIGRLFLHEKSGARLFYISNDDINKVFSISFRTPPSDSTGLPHILEHSVLCGSRKYPVKEPFVELNKGTLNTFLNAMTYPDKTMYPIASTNDKDFINLMDVYLDAVLYPNIYKKPEILAQEGWHYHIEKPEDPITYNGVVYNEMKGAFSNPEEVVYRKIQESLFPDTPYGVESGGDPDIIPNLTQDQFINFHKKYYHPSNSYIYLYGNGNILNHLKYIDREFLGDFEKINIDSSIPLQNAFETQKENIYHYPISKNEKEEDKTYLSMNFVVGKAINPEQHLAFLIFTHILLNSPSAPLKKALMDAQIGKDVSGYFEPSIVQPIINVLVKNSNESEKNRFQKIIFETLNELVEKGIDKRQIQAAININEFKLREADHGPYPKGLIYGIEIMDSWLYDANPNIHLEYEKPLQNIKKALENDYFEQLIKKYLIDNNHRSVVIVKPEQGMGDKKENEIRNHLKEFKSSLSKNEINKLIEETNSLIKMQNTPDKQEDIEKIPILPLDDIKRKVEKYPLEEKKMEDISIFHHSMFTSGISYINFLYSIDNIPKELLPYVSLLTRYLGKVSTQIYDFSELINEIEIKTGGISFFTQTFSDIENIDKYNPKLIVKTKALTNKIPDLFNLLREILCFTKFTEQQRLKEIIQEIKAQMEMRLLSAGHVTVANRLYSYYSEVGKYLETLKGIDYYNFIADLEKNFDNKKDEIFEKLREVNNLIFNRNNLLISVTNSSEDYEVFVNSLNILTNSLEESKNNNIVNKFEVQPLNEGLMTSSKVQYVGKAYNYKLLGYDYSGALLVLKSILSMDYLWNRVRVQGGAYGAFFSADKNGNLLLVSYRDPNLENTFKVYNSIYNFIDNLDLNEREMQKYIIGTISSLDTPLTPSMKGEKATALFLSKISEEYRQKERDNILKCNLNDIKILSQMVKECMDKDFKCVLGNESKINEANEHFDRIYNLFE